MMNIKRTNSIDVTSGSYSSGNIHTAKSSANSALASSGAWWCGFNYFEAAGVHSITVEATDNNDMTIKKVPCSDVVFYVPNSNATLSNVVTNVNNLLIANPDKVFLGAQYAHNGTNYYAVVAMAENQVR